MSLRQAGEAKQCLLSQPLGLASTFDRRRCPLSLSCLHAATLRLRFREPLLLFSFRSLVNLETYRLA